MTETTYSTIGPWSSIGEIKIPPITVEAKVDLAPVLEVLERVEAAVRMPPRFHVPIPIVNIEQRPQDAPVIEVIVPESVINLTVPEMPVAPVNVHVASPKVDVVVGLPGLSALLIANAVVLLALALSILAAALRLWGPSEFFPQ